MLVKRVTETSKEITLPPNEIHIVLKRYIEGQGYRLKGCGLYTAPDGTTTFKGHTAPERQQEDLP